MSSYAPMFSIIAIVAVGCLVAWLVYSARRPQPPMQQFFVGGQLGMPQDELDRLRERDRILHDIEERVEQARGQQGQGQGV